MAYPLTITYDNTDLNMQIPVAPPGGVPPGGVPPGGAPPPPHYAKLSEAFLRNYFGLDEKDSTTGEYKYPILLFNNINNAMVMDWKDQPLPLGHYTLVASTPALVNLSTIWSTNGIDALNHSVSIKSSIRQSGPLSYMVVDTTFSSSVMRPEKHFQKEATLVLDFSGPNVMGIVSWSPISESKMIAVENTSGLEFGVSATGSETPQGGITAKYANSTKRTESQRKYWSTLSVLLPDPAGNSKVKWKFVHDHTTYKEDQQALKRSTADFFDDLSVSGVTKDLNAVIQINPPLGAVAFIVTLDVTVTSTLCVKKKKVKGKHHDNVPLAAILPNPHRVQFNITKTNYNLWDINVPAINIPQGLISTARGGI